MHTYIHSHVYTISQLSTHTHTQPPCTNTLFEQVPGDGRELVVMLPDAVKVSAEDGRRVEVRGGRRFHRQAVHARSCCYFSYTHTAKTVHAAHTPLQVRVLLTDHFQFLPAHCPTHRVLTSVHI